ncbi:hypothetical protein EVAR_80921_1 [Eumeta japonica]|uniref:Uncharacterized protein n=1 Tax=Eumeta variegata TaxID=151549 RepID=A0A4C1V239_EUMVA|nr:hypothetical protein EVAR_80921_1 [Eumeta japonica]
MRAARSRAGRGGGTTSLVRALFFCVAEAFAANGRSLSIADAATINYSALFYILVVSRETLRFTRNLVRRGVGNAPDARTTERFRAPHPAPRTPRLVRVSARRQSRSCDCNLRNASSFRRHVLQRVYGDDKSTNTLIKRVGNGMDEKMEKRSFDLWTPRLLKTPQRGSAPTLVLYQFREYIPEQYSSI